MLLLLPALHQACQKTSHCPSAAAAAGHLLQLAQRTPLSVPQLCRTEALVLSVHAKVKPQAPGQPIGSDLQAAPSV
ncbi:hypothetical protein H920_04749 [Fukomys damarensis]|uniref:Uncharacterized protein n=1 Tax=Fukomys damarensis TaxID=885580 RepID=A0A091DU30_FUKDA|nr:hypothetical protein H920_04749 [Fukomys damarensis]